MNGKQLVDLYCTRCHLAPRPFDVPKETWPTVLGWMGHFVGFHDDELGEHMRKELVEPYADFSGMSLPTPIMSAEAFEVLKDYLISAAPAQSELLVKPQAVAPLKGFELVTPKFKLPGNNLILGIAIDTPRDRLYVGSAKNNDLSAFALSSGRRLGHVKFDAEPRYTQRVGDSLRVATMGLFGPIGQTMDVANLDSNKPQVRALLNDGCWVQSANMTRDMNGDGREDIVSACFGRGWGPYGEGRLSIYWQTPEYAARWKSAKSKLPPGRLPDAFLETRLWDMQGIVEIAVEDFDKDGKIDVMALVANGFQQLVLFHNEGNERFTMRILAEYPPSYGGMALAAKDFDGDGYPDIIITRGNNQELLDGKPARPYHGIYVLQNNRDLTFTQKLFYPMYGAAKTVAADFDDDGDVDLAAVALDPYMALDQPQTFVYLQNEGDWRVSAATLPIENWGRWTDIAVGDVNNDGKVDLVLGDGSGWPWNTPKDEEDFKRMLGSRKEFPPLLFLLNRH